MSHPANDHYGNAIGPDRDLPTSAYALGVHVDANGVTAACTDASGRLAATVRVPATRSIAYETAIVEVARKVCATVGTTTSQLDLVVVGASRASLRPSRLFRRIPGGPYWRDVLATGLEFQLATRVQVHDAVVLAGVAESRVGVGIRAGTFLMVRADSEPDAVLVQHQRPHERCIPRTVSSSKRSATTLTGTMSITEVADRLGHLIALPCRAPEQRLVVLGGPAAIRHGRALCDQVGRAVRSHGSRPPRVVLAEVRGDAVLVGAVQQARLYLRNTRRRVSSNATLD